MKTIQTRTAAALLIVAGSLIPAFAQSRGNGQGRGQDRDDRPQQQQREARSDDRREDRQQVRQQDRQRQPQPQFQQRQSDRQQSYNRQRYQPQNNYRGGGNSNGYRSGGGLRWSDRGGYRGRFIPQSRFNRSFGRQHFFRIGRPVYYNGFSQFNYGGYGFQILDPVPAYWGQNWYDANDVYVDYENDGYYMYNRSYPGVGLAININF